MSTEGKSFIKVFAAGCLWGTVGLFVKKMEALGSSPSYTSFLRLLLGTLLMVILTLVIAGPKAFQVGKRTFITCILMGIVSTGLFNIVYSRSITLNGMAIASVLMYTSPVFVGIASVLLFQEHLTKHKWFALLINVIGCALTATGGHFGGSSLVLTGILFGIGAGFTYAMSAVFGRIAMQEKASSFAVTTYSLLFGCLFLTIFTRPWTTVDSPLNPHLLLVGSLYALIPTALTYSLYYSSLGTIRQTSKVQVVASIEPVVAILLGVLVFGERIGIGNIAGIALVLFSIFLFSRE